MHIFTLPDLGEGLTEAQLRQWYVTEGQQVTEDQPLACVETAKTLVDIPAPVTGMVTMRHAVVDQTVSVGAPLVTLEEHPQKMAMPVTRAVAALQQRDLRQAKPSGPHTHIRTVDLATEDGTPEILQGPRRQMALNMQAFSQHHAPVTLMQNVDIHHWPPKTDTTLKLIASIIAACAAQPQLNAHYHHAVLSRTLMKKIHLGIALDTGDALYVPVIKDVAALPPEAIREKIDQWKAQARKGALPTQDLGTPSIVLSNFGSIAGQYATPMVVPPSVAIVGAGRVFEAVVAVQGQVCIHKVLPLSVTIDHRAVTGGESARFLKAMMDHL